MATNARAHPEAADPLRKPQDYHPLEAIPLFRRVPPSPVRDIAYTFLWNVALTAGFLVVAALLDPRSLSAAMATKVFVITQCVGYAIHLFFVLGAAAGWEAGIHRRSGFAVVAYYTVVATLGVVGGYLVAVLLLDLPAPRFLSSPRGLAMVGLNSVIISSVIATIFFSREREAKASAALAAERLRVERMEREATVANLRALQAQVEPHFLFNTLANATSLIDSDPARAKHMLESFIRFLRATLASTRRHSTTLAEEFGLIRAFLEVLQVRMGERLAVELDLPADLEGVEIPSMLLQPLVENAIRHGLEPCIDGGLVALRARREGGGLAIEVLDTGAGFTGARSGGIGLANVRERLRLAHGDGARLVIREHPPRGTRVVIEMPLAAP